MNELDIRRRRLPSVPVSSVQGALALDLADPRPDPAGPGGPPPRDVATARRHDVVVVDPAQRLRFERWAGRYLQTATEVVTGDRQASQLLRWSAAEVYEQLVHRARVVRGAAGVAAPTTPVRPLLRPQVRALHTSFVRTGACEVAAVVRYGERARAVAARFELLDGRMQCTALEFA
jgi:hypothetical protein